MSISARLRRDAAILLVAAAAASFGGCSRAIPGPRVAALPIRAARAPYDLRPSASCEDIVDRFTELAVRRASTWVDAQRSALKASCSGKHRSLDDCINPGGTYGYDMCSDTSRAGGFGPNDAMIRVRPGPSAMGSGPRAGSSAKRDAPEQVSTTNLQVEGVDEPDIVKSDGSYVYVARPRGVAVVRAWPPEKARLVATIPVAGRDIRMLLADKKLVVLAIEEPSDKTRITVFDVTDPSKARAVRELVASGSFVGARRIGSAVHAVLSQPFSIDDRLPFVMIPQICRADLDDYFEGIHRDMVSYLREHPIEEMLPTLEDVALAGGTRTTTGRMRNCNLYEDAEAAPDRATSVVSFDLNGGAASMISTLTDAAHLYASAEHLFVVRAARASRPNEQKTLGDDVTAIDRFALRNAAARYAGSTAVGGAVPGSFGLDEHGGRLRVVTTATHAGRRGVSLTVIGERAGAAVIEGSIDGVAPGEELRGVRFVGRRAYVVTFRTIDPLFVIDVEGPQPRLLGELKIPGFSTYLHPLDDEHVLTLGLDTEEAGGLVRAGGVRLQIVGVGDPHHPSVRHLEILPERSSNALHDHHAFTFVPAPRGVLVLPVGTGARDSTALAVYGVSAASGFRAVGRAVPAARPALRSLVMDEYVLAIAEDAVEAFRLSDLKASVATVRLGP